MTESTQDQENNAPDPEEQADQQEGEATESVPFQPGERAPTSSPENPPQPPPPEEEDDDSDEDDEEESA